MAFEMTDAACCFGETVVADWEVDPMAEEAVLGQRGVQDKALATTPVVAEHAGSVGPEDCGPTVEAEKFDHGHLQMQALERELEDVETHIEEEGVTIPTRLC